MILKYYEHNLFTDFIKSSDALVHYTKKNIAFEYILLRNELKYGVFSNTNDPQEYKSKLIPSTGYGWSDETFVKIINSGKIIDHKIKKEIGFISFCQNTINTDFTEDGFLKSRMWSQYGENHEGICLVFSKDELLTTINRINQKSMDSIFFGNIEYGDEFEDHPVVNFNEDECKTLTENDIAIKTIINYRNMLFFRKQYDYKDENEFRIINLENSNVNGIAKTNTLDITNSIKGIILGDKFNKVYIPTVNSLIATKNIPIKKLHWEKNQFFLIDMNE